MTARVHSSGATIAARSMTAQVPMKARSIRGVSMIAPEVISATNVTESFTTVRVHTSVIQRMQNSMTAQAVTSVT